MSFDIQQYQIKAEPPPSTQPSIAFFESAWHQPLSEPVRFRIVPRLRVALGASGLFAPILEPNTQIIQFFESRWHFPWSEPKRLRPTLGAYRSPYQATFFDNTPNPSNQLQGWFKEFADPVWPRKGLRIFLQQDSAYHPRMLPPPDVTVTFDPTEINGDDAEFDVWVYTEPPVPIDLTAVNVSITEVVSSGAGAATSIAEES